MKRKSLVITLIIALIIGILATSSSALSFTATMTPSSTTVPESTEFTIVIKVSNLDVGSNGIDTLSGYLKYDTKVFEVISDSSLEALNGWSQPVYNSDNGKISLVSSKFINEAHEVFQITFKTKSGVSGQSGSISFSNIVASNSESDISASDISTTITIGTSASASQSGTTSNGQVDANSVTTNTQNGTVTITNQSSSNSSSSTQISANKIASNTPNNSTSVINPSNSLVANSANGTITSISPTINGTTNNNGINTTSVTNSTSEDDMPYTGVEDVALRAIFVVLVISAISYFKYESMKDVK